MFCFKCGKEISDDAVFCDKCGTKIGRDQVSNSQPTSTSIKNSVMTKSEINAKNIFLCSYAIYASYVLFLVLMVIFIDASVFIKSLGSNSMPSGYSFADIIDSDFLLMLVTLAVAGESFFKLYRYFVVANKKRELESYREKFKVSETIDCAVLPLGIIGLIIFGKMEFTTITYIATAIYIAFFFVITILFNKAVQEESNAKYKENHSTSALLKKLGVEDKPKKPEMQDASIDWTCKKCGTVNKALDSFCKDCGKYR